MKKVLFIFVLVVVVFIATKWNTKEKVFSHKFENGSELVLYFVPELPFLIESGHLKYKFQNETGSSSGYLDKYIDIRHQTEPQIESEMEHSLIILDKASTLRWEFNDDGSYRELESLYARNNRLREEEKKE